MSILVSGTLKSPAGVIIAGAHITLTALTTSPDLLAGVIASAVTSDTGYYGMNVLPGVYSLTVAVNGKSQVYGSFRLDGTETTVTLNMVLRRNLVEVSIPDSLLVDFRQIQNNVADDLEAMRQLGSLASGSADNATCAAADAKVSAESAARSEVNAAGSEKKAEQFTRNLQDAVEKAGDSASAAALSAAGVAEQATAAKSAAVEATNQAKAAQEAATNAATEAAIRAAEKVTPAAVELVRAEVAEYADSAGKSALNASGAKDAAEKAASDAALSEKHVADSALAASKSEASAADSAVKAGASEKATALNEQNSATHETNAGQSAKDAELSATKAADAALNAGKSATQAADHAADAQTQATSAATSAQDARKAAEDAQQAATTAASDAVASAVPEAVKQVTTAVGMDAGRAEAAAASAETSNAGAQKALEEAQLIAKTPGKEGPPGPPGPPGEEGRPGDSAYEVWRLHVPVTGPNTDDSMDAFMAYMKGAGEGGVSPPGAVGSIILGMYTSHAELSAGKDIDGSSIGDPFLCWSGSWDEQRLMMKGPDSNDISGKYAGVWTVMQPLLAYGIGLFIRKI